MTTPVNISAGARIRMQRVERGLSLREAAAKLGMTVVELSGVELNDRTFTPEQRAAWDKVCADHRCSVTIEPLDLSGAMAGLPTQTEEEVRAEFGCTCPPGGPQCMTCVMEARTTYISPPLECTCGSDGPDDAECLRCGERDCPHSEPLHYHHDGCPACTDGFRGPVREVTPARTLLDVDAEPVGGWWPDDVGPQPDRVEGPIESRVGTVVPNIDEARRLPLETLLHHANRERRPVFSVKPDTLFSSMVGATILYVPLEEP